MDLEIPIYEVSEVLEVLPQVPHHPPVPSTYFPRRFTVHAEGQESEGRAFTVTLARLQFTTLGQQMSRSLSPPTLGFQGLFH